MQSGCELCGYNDLGVYKEFSESRDNASSISLLLIFFYSIEVPSIVFLYLNSQFVRDSRSFDGSVHV